MSARGEFTSADRWAECERELEDLGDARSGGDTAGRYAGQPVFATDSGLVYDADPASADGCLVHPPASFLGIPGAPLVTFGVDPLGFADKELQGEPPERCPAVHHQGHTVRSASVVADGRAQPYIGGIRGCDPEAESC